MTQWGLDNLFNPGKRHMDDEKRRLQSTREEVGDASGGRRIDLEAGKVSISVRRPTDVTVDDDTDETTAVTTADDSVDLTADDTALDPALEAEDVPAVALANDEAEIAPELVDEPATADDDATDDDEPVAAAAVDDVPATPPAATADDVPIEAPAPEPVVAAPRRRQLSASAWSRRG